MSKAKASDIRQMTDEELMSASRRGREELFQLRFQQHTAQLTNTAKIREIRRELARVLTVMTERNLREDLTVRPIEMGAVGDTPEELQDEE